MHGCFNVLKFNSKNVDSPASSRYIRLNGPSVMVDDENRRTDVVGLRKQVSLGD